ncbi:MAG: AraC family transcriptional regulator, partial [Geodermatophilaceae bacterium]|nr:AraC family transcriptional regulator [Geodermatophilaceae bacterium]
GAGHVIASDLDATPRPYHDLIAERPHQPTSVGGRLELPGAGALTHLLCGGYTYQHDGAHPVLSLLPPLVHLPATAAGSAHHTTLQMLAAELDHDQPGTQTVADRLVDVLFVHILRAWAAHDDGRVHWLRALRDPHTARAMSAMHLNPAKLWTVADLARVAGLSRATFARRFTDLVGEPPLTYLTRWRMDLAARRLRTVDQPVAAVGRSVGYTSEFAFSRAFSRHRGTPPANYRARHTDQALENIGTESSAKNELGHGAEVGAGSFRPKTSPS